MPHSTQRTRTAAISFIPSGMTVIRISPEAIQSLEDAKQNIAAAVQIGAPERRPLLVDIRGCLKLE